MKYCFGIVGMGVGGSAALCQLLSNPDLSNKILKIIIFEPNEYGKSFPYSHDSHQLLMNTSVGLSSIVWNNSKHFYRWLTNHFELWRDDFPHYQKVSLASYAPRKLYGMYLNDVVGQKIKEASERGITIEAVRDTAVDIFSNQNHQIIELKSGKLYKTDYLIVATAGMPIKKLNYLHLNMSPFYFPTPYVPLARYRQIPKLGRVFIIGSRLASIDAFRLLKETGFEGEVVIASRSGIFPAVRSEVLYYNQYYSNYKKIKTLSSLAETLKQYVEHQDVYTPEEDLEAFTMHEIDWQEHLIPFMMRANHLWKNESQNSRRAFIDFVNNELSRYISSYPVEVANDIVSEICRKKLCIKKGTSTVSFCEKDNTYHVVLDNAHQEMLGNFDYVINATNQGKDIYPEGAQLYKSLQYCQISKKSRLTVNPRIYVAGFLGFEYAALTNATFAIVFGAHRVIQLILEKMGLPMRINDKINTVIILSTRQISFMLDFIKSSKTTRFVLVTGYDEDFLVRKHHLYEVFDAVYRAPVEKKKNILSTYSSQSLKDVMKAEIQILIEKRLPENSISIVTMDESNIYLASEARDFFSLRGALKDQIIYFRDKKKMKDLLSNAKIRVPKYLFVDNRALLSDSSSYYKSAMDYCGLPFIVKPVDSAGSDGVYQISSEEDFFYFVEQRFSENEAYEVEEFIQGQLYHVDTVIYDGKLKFSCACEYTCGNLDFQFGKILGSLYLMPEDPISQRLIAFALRCLKALGFPDGCQQIELFLTEHNEIVFLETAARGPGLDTNVMYMEVFGVCPTLLELALVTTSGAYIPKPHVAQGHFFWACIPKEKGTVVGFNEPDIRSKYKITWNVAIGDELEQATSNLDAAGSIFIWNDHREALEKDFEFLRSFKAIRYMET